MTDHLDKAKKLVDAGQHEVVQAAIVNCELSAIAHALIAIAQEQRVTNIFMTGVLEDALSNLRDEQEDGATGAQLRDGARSR